MIIVSRKRNHYYILDLYKNTQINAIARLINSNFNVYAK